MRKFLVLAVSLCAVLGVASPGVAETWTWSYTPAAGESVTAAITPLKYAKKWAYGVEIDDTPKTTLTVVQPLMSSYHYTDAPPGVAGGNLRPLVGSTAMMVVRVDGNTAYLDWNDIRTLISAGWGAVNHGYWHTGNHWDPAAFLTPDQFRRELYWAQQVIGLNLYNGQRTTAHVVYPNGDYNYQDYLEEFGIRSGSHVAGYTHNIGPGANFERIGRNNLDGLATSNPMKDFPAAPAELDYVLDFTHGVSAAPSDNYSAWQQRVSTIAATYGAGGTDEFWSAPSEDIVSYRLAAQASTVQVANGTVQLTVNGSAPASPLTIRIDGVSPGSQMTVPPGGLLYRQGTTAWITTPLLNADNLGAKIQTPPIKLIYDGAYTTHVTLPKPKLFAGLRFKQSGNLPAGFVMSVQMHLPDGNSRMLNVQKVLDWSPMGNAFGVWRLFGTLPDEDPVLISGLTLPAGSCFSWLQVYAVEVPGDFNGDGFVSQGDYTIWADTFGFDGSPGKTDMRADGNGDGRITHGDYTIWADNYGKGWRQGNKPPKANAGSDQTIHLPQQTVTLAGVVTDDGLPNPPAATSLSWTMASGPAQAAFSDASAATTTATLPALGTYVLRLTASDGELTAYDDVTVVAEAAPTNQPPTVDAGESRSSTWPINWVSLLGSASDDGLGNPPGTVTLQWSKQAGPGDVTFSAPTAAGTTATFSAAGVYTVRLTASDGELSGFDDVTVVIGDGSGPALQVITPSATGSVSGYQATGSLFDSQPAGVPSAGATSDPMGVTGGFYTMAGRSAYIDFGQDYASITITELWMGLKLNGVDPNGVAPVTFWSSSLHATYDPASGDVAAPTFGIWNFVASTGVQSWQRLWTGSQTPAARYYILTFDGTQNAGNRMAEIVFVGSVSAPLMVEQSSLPAINAGSAAGIAPKSPAALRRAERIKARQELRRQRQQRRAARD